MLCSDLASWPALHPWAVLGQELVDSQTNGGRLNLSVASHHGFPRWTVLKNLPAVREARVRSLGQEEPLEKEMATCSSILAWRILWTEEPDGLQSMGSQRVRYD